MKISEMKLDKSADITGKSQLLVLGRFIAKEEIAAQLSFCPPLQTTSKGQDIFSMVENSFSLDDLFSDSCIKIVRIFLVVGIQ